MHNEFEMAELINEIIPILSAWGINTAQQAVLLGLPLESMNHHRLTLPLLRDNEVLTRIPALLAIDHSMCLALPHIPELARLWISTPSRFFAGHTPLEVMLAEGLSGIVQVRALLEGTESW